MCSDVSRIPAKAWSASRVGKISATRRARCTCEKGGLLTSGRAEADRPPAYLVLAEAGSGRRCRDRVKAHSHIDFKRISSTPTNTHRSSSRLVGNPALGFLLVRSQAV